MFVRETMTLDGVKVGSFSGHLGASLSCCSTPSYLALFGLKVTILGDLDK